jgi:hypothetical protein
MMTAAVWFLGLALTAQVPPPRAAEVESQALQAERHAIRTRETADLMKLSADLGAAGRRADAEAVEAQIEPSPPGRGPFRFRPLLEWVPARTKPLASVPGAPAGLAAIQKQTVAALEKLYLRALGGEVKHYSVADECLRAILMRDPDHAEARRLLGYVAHGGGWATPFAVDQFKKGKVLHSTYGWVDAAWVPHLENGELPARGMTSSKDARWLPAAEANAQRNTIKRGWTIRTEHFEIQADVPLSEAIAFGRKVELFHDLLFSLMADVVAKDLPLAQRFHDKGKAQVQPRPAVHSVFYFATKEEYIEYLQSLGETKLESTLGIYIPPKKPGLRRAPAYFFSDQGGALDVTATLFHEVSHQLLQESTGAQPNAFRKNFGNFWVFEGLGTYFETVVVHPDNSLEFGGYVGPRIRDARRRMLENGQMVPIEQLVRLNQDALLGPDDDSARLHYAESMALAVYLMEGQGGKYREDFLDYVRDALHGRLKSGGSHQLDDRIGISYKELDAELLADLKPPKDPPNP